MAYAYTPGFSFRVTTRYTTIGSLNKEIETDNPVSIFAQSGPNCPHMACLKGLRLGVYLSLAISQTTCGMYSTGFQFSSVSAIGSHLLSGIVFLVTRLLIFWSSST